MTHIEGTSQPGIGQNNYTIVADKDFVPRTTFFWRISSSLHQGDFVERQKRVAGFTFTRQHVGMNFTIEAKYKNEADKWVKLSKNVRVTASAASPSDSNKPKEATPDTGNKSAVINTPDDRPRDDGEEKRVKLKIHVYFDGTFGNKDNINNMESAINKVLNGSHIKPSIYDEKYRNEKGEIDHDEYKTDLDAYNAILKNNESAIREELDFDPADDQISYTQVHTNIGIMHDIETVEEYDEEKIIKIYIEGVGTETGGGDDMAALATGTNLLGTGIESKIKRAFDEIKKRTEKKGIKTDTITGVEICAIGFSRGAATTRNFVAEREKLLSTLKKVNNNISDTMISYKFVGIFDTVCSVTSVVGLTIPLFGKYSIQDEEYNDEITTLQRNNIKDYKLAMKGNVEEVVHLVAANEYRLFFPLTNIQTSIDSGCGYELILPGSHCDLGGGDKDSIYEAYEEDVMAGDENIIPNFLMDNLWFDRTDGTPITELNSNKDTYVSASGGFILGGGIYRSSGYDVVGTKYELERNVAVGYNKIPLCIMLHYSMSLAGIVQNGSLYANKTSVHAELEGLKTTFLDYVENKKHEHTRDTKLLELFEKQYTHLRKDFIHISALERDTWTVHLKNQMRTTKTNKLVLSIYATFWDKYAGVPRRAIYNDGDCGMNMIEYFVFRTGQTIGKAVGIVVKKGEELIDTAKEKGEELLKQGAEELGNAGKKAGVSLLKKIIKKIGKPIIK